MKAIIVFAAVLVALVESAKWDSLKVTWNPNPFSSNAFANLPRKIHIDAMGFTMKDNMCNGNQPGLFAGRRYWVNNDPAVVLLFDVNGIIAGIQTVVPKVNWPSPAGKMIGHPIIDDGHNYVLTAYFVDPKLETQGTGTGLFIQNGTDPINSLITIPLDESQTVARTQWKFGHCFYTMGDHYWYNNRVDLPCSEFFPGFILYNKRQLNAFGWAINAALDSPRYEHVPHILLGHCCMDPVPQCFSTDPTYETLRSMHIYFSSEISDLC